MALLVRNSVSLPHALIDKDVSHVKQTKILHFARRRYFLDGINLLFFIPTGRAIELA